jgi:hypothetical protein
LAAVEQLEHNLVVELALVGLFVVGRMIAERRALVGLFADRTIVEQGLVGLWAAEQLGYSQTVGLEPVV